MVALLLFISLGLEGSDAAFSVAVRSLQLLNLMVAQLLRFFKGLVKAYGLAYKTLWKKHA